MVNRPGPAATHDPAKTQKSNAIAQPLMEVRFLDTTALKTLVPIQCDGPIMVMPFTDLSLATRAANLASTRAGVTSMLLAVYDENRQGFIATVNQTFAATQSPWFGYVAQDAFAGRAWLALAVRAMQTKKAGLLGFNDGKWQGQLASFGLAERTWIKSVYGGDFFHGAYGSHYADTELTLIAREQGRYVYEPNSVLVEVDWDKESATVSATDRALFKSRAAAGFGGRVQNPQLLHLFG